MVRPWYGPARVVMRRGGRPNDYIWWVSHNYFVAHVPMMAARDGDTAGKADR